VAWITIGCPFPVKPINWAHMHTRTDEAEREKRSAAFTSVTAAVLLTVLKLVVGFSTNSLGILSEAAHSAMDLLAAAVTYAAVRYSAFPPDSRHPYGHGKMENLAALVESTLLLAICVWVVWEAVDRLFFTPALVKPSLWALAVMVVSIVVDISRSRLLLKVAKKYNSQALEADAIHFSTDVLSSGVVIVGILALYLAGALPESSVLRPWLERADALAALGVSAIIIRVSWNLGKRAVNVLLDAGDESVAATIRAALKAIPGVKDIISLRLRHSGPDLFVDLTLGVMKGQLIDEIEQIRAEVEGEVHKIVAHAAISAVLVPYQDEDRATPDRIMRLRGLAAVHGLVPHAVELFDLEAAENEMRHRLAELHVEFPPETTLKEAHAKVSVFENAVRGEEKDLIIVTHIEPMGKQGEEKIVQTEDSSRILAIVQHTVDQEPLIHDAHQVLARRYGKSLRVSFHCRMDPQTTVDEAHAASKHLQAALHAGMPELSRVTVHMEPFHDDHE